MSVSQLADHLERMARGNGEPLTRAALIEIAEQIRSSEPDPVGAVEVAERLNVKRRTVDQWRQRATDFPAPRWTVGGRPAWNFDDVEAWAKRTGRLDA